MASQVSVDTVEQALAFLSRGETEDDVVRLTGSLLSFHAHIDGENYHTSIPAGLARGLWELQEELYRAVAFALYGDESYKRLTEEQKEKFELVFQVSEGSVNLLAPLETFFKELGEGFKTMDSAHKMKTLVAIALVMAMAWGAISIQQSLAENKIKVAEIEADSKDKQGVRDLVLQQQKAHAEQIASVANAVRDAAASNPAVGRFAKATENGTRAIIKGASDADRIVIGKAEFDREAILEVNQRAAKEAAQASIVKGEYRVVRSDARDGGVTRFWLVGEDNVEFSGIIIDEDFDAKGLNQLWEALRGRTRVTLEINLTLMRGQIKNASILRVVGPVQATPQIASLALPPVVNP